MQGTMWPSGSPVWGGDANGSTDENTVTFNKTGVRDISATWVNTVKVSINVVDNLAQDIAWTHKYHHDNQRASSKCDRLNFAAVYSARADVENNLWYLTVATISGGTEIYVHTGGFTDPDPGVNIQTVEVGRFAIGDMLNESSPNGPALVWCTEDAIYAHEEWHKSEWTNTANHYWPSTELAMEELTVPYDKYVNDLPAAVAALKKLKAGKADDMVSAFEVQATLYIGLLKDDCGTRPYIAGAVKLNPEIEGIRTFGANQHPPWDQLPPGSNPKPGTDYCYEPWLPYNP